MFRVTRWGVTLQATQQLMDELPSYAELTRPAAASYQTQHDGAQGKQAALWLRDSVLATRVQFLMNVLGPCLPVLPQVGRHFCPVQYRNNPKHCTLCTSAQAQERKAVLKSYVDS